MEQKSNKKDFFISYNHNDDEAAQWIAWNLEKEGYTTIIQVWDFLPGNNFVEKMDNALRICKSTIAVLSDHYLQAGFTKPEWQAAFAKDPTGEKRSLIPIRIQPCDLTGFLGQIIYIDLVGLKEEEARKKLLEGVQETRLIPKEPPPFRGFETRPVPGINRDEILEKRKIEIKAILEKTIKHNYHMTLKLEEEIEKEIEIEDENTGRIEKRKELVWEEVALEKILEDKNNYILINPSGMGKTTFLTYIACDLLNRIPNYPFFPLLITCIEINKRGTASSVNDFIQRSFESFYCNSKTLIIDNEWENVCILIDALDQARDVNDIASSLHLQNKYGNYKKAKIIISSRQNTAGKIKEGFNKIRLKLPEDDEVRHYLGEEHYDNIESLLDSSRELITVPVLLEMLKIISDRGHISSKILNRSSLYNEFTRILVDQERNKPRYWQDPPSVKHFINYELEKSLEKIAFFPLANNEILEIGKDRLKNYCESPERKEALLNTGIILELFEDREHQLVFRHQSFQSYFAAKFIYYQQPEYFKQLTSDIAFFYSDVWYEVLRFYVGLERDHQKAEEIINSIYQKEDKEDDLNHSLKLIFAFFLMSETKGSSEKIDELYERLRNLFENKKGYFEFIKSNIDKFNTSNKDQRERINIISEPLIRDDDSSVRSDIVEALGELGTSKDISLLEPLLRDEERSVREFAAHALSKIVTAKDIPLLEPLLMDENRDIRAAATQTLSKIGTVKDIPLLEQLLRDEDLWVREAAAEALSKIVTAKDIPLLEQLLRDEDKNVRVAVAQAVGKIVTVKDIPLLEQLLRDEDLWVREAATKALSKIVTAKDIPLLEQLLRDEDKNVRVAVAIALVNTITSEEIHLLEPLLRDDYGIVRSIATKTLGKIGASKEIPLLEPMLRDYDKSVRSSAAKAMSKLGTSKDIPLLEPLLKDFYVCVRSAVAEALGELGTSKDIPLLEPLLFQPLIVRGFQKIK
jgi:HEAT repeat protein